MNPHEYDIIDPDAPAFQMTETCLADKIWNLLWREKGFRTDWLTMHFSEDEEAVWDAVDQLEEEGRAFFTPAGRRLNPIWNFPDQRH